MDQDVGVSALQNWVEPKTMADGPSAPSQAALHRLTTIWSGLPACSVIVLRHLQKTGGSSVVKLFEDLQQDLQWSVAGYWTPCWRSRATHVAQGRLRWLRGLRRLATLVNGSLDAARQLLLDTPPWSLRMLLHVHHPDSIECGGLPALQRELLRLRPHVAPMPCHTVVAMLVRAPWSFHVSFWYYAGRRRCGECSFLQYLELNPNAQAHMAVGRKAREYSDALRARHAARDGRLRLELAQTLDGIDLLGPTERLDDFVAMLCERAGLRVCPRPGHTNAQRYAGSRVQAAATRGGANMSGFAPDATSMEHVRAVEHAGWLDAWFHERAHKRMDEAMGAGGAASVAARRRRLEEWRALPEDQSSGCLAFGEVSPADAEMATARVAATAVREKARTSIAASTESPSRLRFTFRIGAGGTPESHGLWQLPWRGHDALSDPGASGRCMAVRQAAREAGSRAAELVPPALRPVLLEEGREGGGAAAAPDAGDGSRRAVVAMCSTKVRLAGVRRGCHVD